MRRIRGAKNKTGQTTGKRLQPIPGGHPKGVDVMKTSRTKYTTWAGLCTMAVVLAAAVMLAGCKIEPSRQETQLEKDIKALAGKGPGIHRVTATATLTTQDLENVRNALRELPDGVKVDLILTPATGLTAIGYRAFSNCFSLASVTIPEGVTTIGEAAFWACRDLSSITLPQTLTSIGSSAFSACISLSSITLPQKLASIGSSAFNRCDSLTEVTFADNNSTWTLTSDSYDKDFIPMYTVSGVKVDNPSQNAEKLTKEYLNYNWNKK